MRAGSNRTFNKEWWLLTFSQALKGYPKEFQATYSNQNMADLAEPKPEVS